MVGRPEVKYVVDPEIYSWQNFMPGSRNILKMGDFQKPYLHNSSTGEIVVYDYWVIASRSYSNMLGRHSDVHVGMARKKF